MITLGAEVAQVLCSSWVLSAPAVLAMTSKREDSLRRDLDRREDADGNKRRAAGLSGKG